VQSYEKRGPSPNLETRTPDARAAWEPPHLRRLDAGDAEARMLPDFPLRRLLGAS